MDIGISVRNARGQSEIPDVPQTLSRAEPHRKYEKLGDLPTGLGQTTK
jgi:hypothetical protein